VWQWLDWYEVGWMVLYEDVLDFEGLVEVIGKEVVCEVVY